MFRLVFGPLAAKKNSDTARKPRLTLETMESRITPDATLIASSFFDGAIYKFNSETGALTGTLAAANSGDTAGPAGLELGPDGNLYISNQFGGNILRYNFDTQTFSTFIDAAVLAPIAVTAGAPSFSPAGLRFGPDGDLYVNLNGGQSSTTGKVVKFDITNTAGVLSYDAVVNNFTAFGSGLVQPSGMVFGKVGDTTSLYVSNFGAGSVAKFAAATTTPTQSTFVAAGGAEGLNTPAGLTWAADGNLLVVDLGATSNIGQVLEYNKTTGAFDHVFTAANSLQFQFPSDALYDAGGHLLTANLGPAFPPVLAGSISKFNADGSAAGTLVSSSDFPNTGPGTPSGISPSELALLPNVAPVLTLPAAVFADYTENAPAVVIDPDASVADPDEANFNGGVLTVSLFANGTASDELGIKNVGTGAGQIGVSGANVTYGGAAVGTFAVGTAGGNLVVTFTSSAATKAVVDALLQNITFRTVTENPSELPRTVRFVLNDGNAVTGTSAPVDTTVTVTAVNDAPTATTGSNMTTEDNAVSGAVSGTDPENDPLTFAVFAGPSFGILTAFDAATGSYTYTPNLNYNGSDAFTFTANDGVLTSAPAGVSLTVTAVNDAPVANNGSNSTLEDTAVSGTVTATDVDNVNLTFTKASDPANGTVTVAANGAYTYTPNLNYNGPDSFTFTASDGALTSTGTITVTVTAVNDAPKNTVPPTFSVVTGSQLALTGLAVADDDADVANVKVTLHVDGGVLHIRDDVTNGLNGSHIAGDNTATLTLTAPLSRLNATFVDPAAVFFNAGGVAAGPVKLTMTTNDLGNTGGPAQMAMDTATITVHSQPPTASNSSLTTLEDTDLTDTAMASDPDNATLTYAVVTPPTNGTLTAFNTATGAFTYKPAVNYFGSDSFQFTARDAETTTAPATVAITVSAVNDAPVAAASSQTTAEDTAVPASVSATDVDLPAQTLTYAVGTGPTNGTLTAFDAATGAYTYKPAQDYNGPDSFTFTASDGAAVGGTSNTATVSLTVTVVNDAPVAAASSQTTAEDTAVPASVSATDVDLPAQTLTYAVGTGPTHGTLTAFNTATGAYTYMPAQDYFGPDNFTFTASDGAAVGGTSAAATVSLTVTAVNDKPVIAVNTGVTVIQGASVAITQAKLEATDVDNTAAQLTFTLTAAPAHGSVRLNGGDLAVNGTFTQADVNAGVVTFRHDNTAGTSDSFNVTVSDGDKTATATVNIAVATAPVVTTQPVNQQGFAGAVATVTFTAAAGGNPAPTVQWQVSTDGGMTFANIPGATATTLTTAARVGDQFRAVFTNIAGSATSNVVTVTAKAGLEVLTPPQDQKVVVGKSVTFSADATGSTETSVQWQYSSDNGATYSNIPKAATGLTYTVKKADASKDGDLFRAVFKNAAGVAVTPAARLTVNNTVTLYKTTQAVSVRAGTPVTLVAKSKLKAPVDTFQWEVSVNKGKTYTVVAATPTLMVTTVPGAPVRLYRAAMTTAGKTAFTPVATVTTVAPPTVATSPLNAFSANGKATFTAVAGLNAAKETVMWQVSTDGGMTFTAVSKANGETVVVTPARAAVPARGSHPAVPAKPTTTTLTVSTKGLPTGPTNRLYRAVFVNAVGETETALAMLTVVS